MTFILCIFDFRINGEFLNSHGNTHAVYKSIKYSPTCLRQATKGTIKIACLRQVLA